MRDGLWTLLSRVSLEMAIRISPGASYDDVAFATATQRVTSAAPGLGAKCPSRRSSFNFELEPRLLVQLVLNCLNIVIVGVPASYST